MLSYLEDNLWESGHGLSMQEFVLPPKGAAVKVLFEVPAPAASTAGWGAV